MTMVLLFKSHICIIDRVNFILPLQRNTVWQLAGESVDMLLYHRDNSQFHRYIDVIRHNVANNLWLDFDQSMEQFVVSVFHICPVYGQDLYSTMLKPWDPEFVALWNGNRFNCHWRKKHTHIFIENDMENVKNHLFVFVQRLVGFPLFGIYGP